MTKHKIVFVILFVPLAALVLVLLLRRDSDEILIGLCPAASISKINVLAFSVMTNNIQTRPWLDDAWEKLPLISALLKGFDVLVTEAS